MSAEGVMLRLRQLQTLVDAAACRVRIWTDTAYSGRGKLPRLRLATVLRLSRLMILSASLLGAWILPAEIVHVIT